MNDSIIIPAIGFTAPLVTALISCGMCMAYYLSGNSSGRKKHILLIIFTFMAASFCWVPPLLLLFSHELFVTLNSLFFLVSMLALVLLYHFIFIITGTEHYRRLSVLNYIIPVTLTIVMLVWSINVPFTVRLELARGEILIHPDYPAYSTVFFASMLTFCIYNILYTLLGFYRVGQYRRHIINFSADSQRTSLRWLYAYMVLVLSSIPLPFAGLFIDKNTIVGSQLAIVGAMLPIVQYTLIVYNVISGNYVMITPVSGSGDVQSVKTEKLSRKRFETFICERKPYLNPELRITDLAGELCTNRTYLSGFINSEYSMNFSRYINRLRLEELDRLRRLPQSRDETNMELVLRAGFSSYRSYLRAKSMEDKSKLLKIFD